MIRSDKLVYVPITNPKTPVTINIIPKTITRIFLNPLSCDQKVSNCIIAGKINPSVVKHRAPNNDIYNSKFGIIAASATVIEKKI